MTSSVALTLLAMVPPGAAGQDGGAQTGGQTSATPVSVSVPRVARPPVLDGVTDDETWSEARAMSGFVQRTPRDGEPATQDTWVWVAQDEANLYVAVRATDDQPGQLVEGESIRDSNLDRSDAVLLIFDTYQDGQNGFVFGTNPAGIQYDGQVVDQGGGSGGFRGGGLGGGRQQAGSGGGFNLNWDGSWQVATSRDEGGWSAEFRIPFSTLRYGPGSPQDWGFNVARRLRRLNEESFWSPVSREFNLFRVSEAGTISGLEPPTVRTVDVTPYVLARTARDYTVDGASFDEAGEIGGDAKIQVTQGLTLDLTYNTDFAQVEVDDAQTNLTRFSLFFPEKRPFFLENAGLFSVGGGQSELFFSRRIGISESGTQVPITGGGRLSGKIAGMNVGLLHIRTEGVEDVQAANGYTVARVAKELPNRSSVGAIYVGRDGLDADGDHNRTYGLDGQLGIGEALNLSGFVAKSETPDRDLRDHVVDMSASWLSRSLRVSGGFREVGEDFNPEVGFLPRNGYRDYNIFWMSFIRPESFLGVREFRPHARYSTIRDLETGFEETATVHVDSHVEWHSGMFFSPAFNWSREGLEEPFEIVEDVTVPPGTYDGWEAAWRHYTNQAAPVSLETSINWGSFLSGTRRGTSAVLAFRRGSVFSAGLRFEYNDVNLDEGDFITRLTGLRLGYFITPDIYVQSLVQYSDQAENWSANVRFGWVSTAGTGLFVVYNQAHGVGDLDGPLNRSFILKYSRQFNAFGG